MKTAEESTIRYAGSGRILISGRRCEFSRIIVSLCLNGAEWLTPMGWWHEAKSVALACDNTPDGLEIIVPEPHASDLKPGDRLEISCTELGFTAGFRIGRSSSRAAPVPPVETPAQKTSVPTSAVAPPPVVVTPPVTPPPVVQHVSADNLRPDKTSEPIPASHPAPKIPRETVAAPYATIASATHKGKAVRPVEAQAKPVTAQNIQSPKINPPIADAATALSSKRYLAAALPILFIVGAAGWWAISRPDTPTQMAAVETTVDAPVAAPLPVPIQDTAGIRTTIERVAPAQNELSVEIDSPSIIDSGTDVEPPILDATVADTEVEPVEVEDPVREASADIAKRDAAEDPPESTSEPEPEAETVSEVLAAEPRDDTLDITAETSEAVTPVEPSPSPAPRAPTRDDIRTLQEDLTVMRYYRGPVTGIADTITLSALDAFKTIFSIELDTELDTKLLDRVSRERRAFESDPANRIAVTITPTPEPKPVPEPVPEPEPEPASASLTSAPLSRTPEVATPPVIPEPTLAPGLEAQSSEATVPVLTKRDPANYPKRAQSRKSVPDSVEVTVAYDIDDEGDVIGAIATGSNYDGFYLKSFEKEAVRVAESQEFEPLPGPVSNQSIKVIFNK